MKLRQIKPLKIAHVSAVFPPYWSGTGNVAYYNALELARRGHDVHVWTAEYPLYDGYVDPPDFHVHRLWTPFRIGNAPLTPHLIKVLRNFDLVHLHWPFIFGSELLWLTSLTCVIPIVVTYHMDLRHERKWIFGPYQSFSGPKLIKKSKRIIAVSSDHLKSTSVYPYIVRYNKKIIEIPNGVDPEQFHPGADGLSIRRKYRIPNDAKLLVFVGALDSAHEYKGVPDLLHAVKKLDRPDVWLLIAGDGDLLPKYKQLAARLGKQSHVNVIFAGSVCHKELPAYYASGDACVLPSREPESFGIVLIEAMACGIPVIASDSPGVRLTVPKELHPFLTIPCNVDDLTQKIRYMLSLSPQERKALGTAGNNKIRSDYSWESAAEKLEQVYLEII